MNYKDLITAILIACLILVGASEFALKHYIISLLVFLFTASYIRDVINYELKELIK